MLIPIYNRILCKLSSLNDAAATALHRSLVRDMNAEARSMESLPDSGSQDRLLNEVFVTRIAQFGDYNLFCERIRMNYKKLRLGFQPRLDVNATDATHPPLHPYFATPFAVQLVEILGQATNNSNYNITFVSIMDVHMLHIF